MDNLRTDLFNKQFKIGADGLSEFTMEQIRAKSEALGLTDALTIEAVALAKDADFSAKAATGKLTFRDALKNGVGSIEEIGDALQKSGKLGEQDFIKLTSAAETSSEAYEKTLHNIINANADIADSFINLADSGENAGHSLLDVFTGMVSKITPLLPAILGISAAIATLATIHYINYDYTRAIESAQQASDEYLDAKASLESLNAEYDTTQSKIEELQSLVSNGTITMAQEVELENLKQQNKELETQISLQQAILDIKAKASADSAKNASNTEMSYLEYNQAEYGMVEGFFRTIGGFFRGSTENENISQYDAWLNRDTTEQGMVQTYLQDLAETEQALSEVEKRLINDPTNKILQDRQKSLNDEILATRQKLADSTSLIQSWIAQSTDVNGNAIDGAESAVDSWRETLNDINNYGKSQNEIDLNNLNTFFSSSNGKSIKKMLDNVAKSGGSAENALEEFRKTGLRLEDIDVSSDGFKRYFQDIVNGLKETENKIAEFDGSLASVETAFNTANQDSKWTSMTEYIASAKEMYDSGLTGTDDFKSVAQMISASPIDVDNEKYKYDADAYVDAWNNAYSQVKSWFNADDQAGSAYNFAESLKTAGLATYDSQDGYTWLFKSSAEAAEKLGTSIEIVEAAMGNLEAQGAEFADVVFSGEALNSYNSALSQVEDIYDNLSDDSILKDRFNEVLAESELQDFANNLENLTEDQIIQIEFEYDLATVEQEIQKAKDRISETGGSNEDYASLTSLQKEERGLLETQVDSSMLSGGYEQASSTIDALGQKMVAQYSTLGEEGRRAIQQQQSALLSLQTSFLDMASRGEVVDWNSFLNTPQASSVIQGLADSMGVDFDTALKTLNDSLSESLDVDDVEFDIKANDKASEVVEKVDKLTMAEKVTEVIAHDEATHVVQLWEELSMNDKFANMSAEDQFTYVVELWESLTPEDKTAYMNGEITVSDFASPVIDNVTSEVASIPKETTTDIKANDKVTSTVQNITTTLNYLDGKTVHTYVVTHHQSKGDGELSGSAHLKGTAFDGGTISNTSWLKDNWRIPSDEYALTGERGMEMYVDPETNTWETLGEKGAEFRHIPKGAVVFNAEQTKKLLSRGYIFSRGKALLNGTAHLGEGNGWRPNPNSAYSGSSGTGSSNNSGNNNSNSNNDSNNSDSKTKDKIDWIAVLLSRIQRVITNVGKVASATFKSWTERSTALESQISSVKQEMEYQKQGAERYLQEANNVGLSDEYVKKVQDGTIDIESIEDETLREQISEYQQWYELALECTDAVQDLEEELYNLSRQKFDNIIQQYDDRLAEIEHSVSILDSLMEQTEAKGYILGASFYKAQQKQEEQNLETLMAERSALQQQLNNSGFEKGTEEWNAMNQEIMDVEESIQDTTLSLIELNNELRQLEWDSFEKMQDLISSVATENDFYIDLMSNNKMFDTDTGAITDEGMATLGLHASNMNVYMAQAEEYAKKIDEINKEIASDPYNQTLIDQRKEWIELQQDSIKSAEDEKQAMKDLAEDGFNVFLDLMSEVIDKRKEMMQNISDLYDFEKSISESNKEISSLQKQIESWYNDDSEEGRLNKQKAQVSLEEEQQNLQEQLYDKYIQDQEKMLDDLYSSTEEWVNQRLDNIDALISGMIDAVNANSSQIEETIKETANEIGITLSKEMLAIWDTSNGSYGSVVSTYYNGFTNQLTTVNATLDAIRIYIANMLGHADEQADSSMKNQQESSQIQENATVSSSNSNQSSTHQEPPKENISESSDTGNFTVGSTINASGAKIYAGAGGTGYSQYFADDPIYTVIGEQGDYVRVRWHKASSGSTGWFKKSDIKAYKNGGLVDYTGLAWMDGTKSNPETVLDAEDTRNLINLTDALEQLGSGNLSYGTSVNNPLMSSMYQIPKATNYIGGVRIGDINVYGVQNAQALAEEVKYLVQNDRGIRNSIKADNIGSVLGKNRLTRHIY